VAGDVGIAACSKFEVQSSRLKRRVEQRQKAEGRNRWNKGGRQKVECRNRWDEGRRKKSKRDALELQGVTGNWGCLCMKKSGFTWFYLVLPALHNISLFA
jgi:hypothetical protein